MKSIYVLLVSCAVVLSSCSTKTSAINDLRSLSTEIQENGAEYNVEQWKKAGQKYEKITNKISQYKYSVEQNREIGELKGKCAAYFAKGVVSNITNKVTNMASQLKGVIDGVKEVIGDNDDKEK